MAEFDDPTALVAAAQRDARRRLPAHGRVLAVPDRGAGRRARHCERPPGAADRAARRDRRRPRRLRPAGTGSSAIAYPLNVGGRPLHQLAGVHPGHLRADDPVRGARRGARHAGAERAAEPYHPVFNVPRFAARQPDRFFLASRRPTRSSIATQTLRRSSRGSGAEGDQRGGEH